MVRIRKRTYHWPKDGLDYHLFRSPMVYVTTLCRSVEALLTRVETRECGMQQEVFPFWP